VATAPTGPLAWEPPVAIEKAKRPKKKKKKKREREKKKKVGSIIPSFTWVMALVPGKLKAIILYIPQ